MAITRRFVQFALVVSVVNILVFALNAQETKAALPMTNGNLAPSPSFEDGSIAPNGWITVTWSGTMTFTWDNTTAHSGSHAVAISNFGPAPSGGCYSLGCSEGYWHTLNSIPINTAHDYFISGWYKNTTQMPWVAFLAEVWGNDSYALGSTGLWAMTPTTEWTYRSDTIHASTWQTYFPGANRVYLMFGATNWNPAPDAGTVWIDDVSFIELPYNLYFPIIFKSL